MKIIEKVVILFFFISACSPPNGNIEPEIREFRAQVSSVRLNSKLISQGKTHNDYVSVKVPSVIFEEPFLIDDARNAKAHRLAEINTVVSYTKANIEGNKEEILSFWCSEDREEKSVQLQNQKMFDANREYHLKHPGINVVGLVYQKSTTAVLLGKHGQVMAVNLRSKGERFCLTDYSANDLELAIIEASFAQRD